MNKICKKIACMLIIAIIMMNTILMLNSEATTEEEELKQMLTELKEGLGDPAEFKAVMDKLYNDIESETTVTEELKETLIEDISKISDVEGIDIVLAKGLQLELESQIENLSEDTFEEVKEEIEILKEWADENARTDNGNDKQSNDKQSNDIKDPTPSENPKLPIVLPKTGKTSIIIISVLIALLSIVVAKSKYNKYKGIK